jgi:hypothetical protein
MTPLFKTLCAAISLSLLLAAGGCSAAGAAAYASTPADTIKAKYSLPKQSTLVLVESYGNAGDANLFADQLGLALYRQLQDHQCGQLLDPKLLAALRETDRDRYDKMTIDGIGRALGAKQIVYVNVVRAELDDPDGSSTARGKIAVVVRVVNATSGETQWPLYARDGEIVQLQTPWLGSDAPVPMRPDVHQDMITRTADAVGKLFYDWEPESPNQETPQQTPNPGS